MITHWVTILRADIAVKLSLSCMDLHDVNPHSARHIWPKGGCSSRSRVAASFRAKLLSGSYILQSNRARFNQNSVKPTCPLCKQAPEDLPHFLRSCPDLEPTRTKTLPKIKWLASTIGMFLANDPETLSLKQKLAEQCQSWLLLRLLWTKQEVKDTNKVQMLTTERTHKPTVSEPPQLQNTDSLPDWEESLTLATMGLVYLCMLLTCIWLLSNNMTIRRFPSWLLRLQTGSRGYALKGGNNQ